MMLLFVLLTLVLPHNISSSEIAKDIQVVENNTTIIISKIYQKFNTTRSIHLDSLPIHKPLDNIHITSDYGNRRHPIIHRRLFHTGIDLHGKMGTPVYTTADGVVIKVKASRFGYGNRVIIRHAGGYSTLYAHLSSILVKEGQQVKRGETIGRIGSTGRSTGPHLHYEVRLNGHHIDPLFFTYDNKEERSVRAYQTYLSIL